MREALIIFAVIALLVVLTAIKYRRQIVGLIGFYKTFKSMRDTIREGGNQRIMRDRHDGIELVKCARCGKWVSPSSAESLSGEVVCSEPSCRSRVS
jgi:hypothetical protein